MSRALPPAAVPVAMRRVRAWSADPALVVACPLCEAPGLDIADRSSRPYAEWYQLTCPACGLEATLSIPMAPPAY